MAIADTLKRAAEYTAQLGNYSDDLILENGKFSGPEYPTYKLMTFHGTIGLNIGALARRFPGTGVLSSLVQLLETEQGTLVAEATDCLLQVCMGLAGGKVKIAATHLSRGITMGHTVEHITPAIESVAKLPDLTRMGIYVVGIDSRVPERLKHLVSPADPRLTNPDTYGNLARTFCGAAPLINVHMFTDVHPDATAINYRSIAVSTRLYKDGPFDFSTANSVHRLPEADKLIEYLGL